MSVMSEMSILANDAAAFREASLPAQHVAQILAQRYPSDMFRSDDRAVFVVVNGATFRLAECAQ